MSNPIPNPHHINATEFGEEEPRSLLVPILLALLVVLAVGSTIAYYTHHKSFATGVIPTTIVYPIHIESKGAIQIVGQGSEDDLYLLPVVEVHNHISLPLFIESLAADVTTADGATYHCTGAQFRDFAVMYAAYPDLGHIVDSTGNSPLQRDTRIENLGGTEHGLVMVHFPISQLAWERRQSASVTISFYHQPPLVVPFPANQ